MQPSITIILTVTIQSSSRARDLLSQQAENGCPYAAVFKLNLIDCEDVVEQCLSRLSTLP